MHSMSMRIHRSHYCLNMTFCRWPPCCSIHSSSHDGKAVITHCNISLGIPWIHSRIHCFRSTILVGRFVYAALNVAPEEVVWSCKVRQAGGPSDVPKMRNESAVNTVLRTCMEMYVVWAVAPSCWSHSKSCWQGCKSLCRNVFSMTV